MEARRSPLFLDVLDMGNSYRPLVADALAQANPPFRDVFSQTLTVLQAFSVHVSMNVWEIDYVPCLWRLVEVDLPEVGEARCASLEWSVLMDGVEISMPSAFGSSDDESLDDNVDLARESFEGGRMMK